MSKWNKITLSVILVFLLVIGCSHSRQISTVTNIIQRTKAHFVPDSRVDRFDVKVEPHSKPLTLTGVTTLPKAKSALMDSLSQRNIKVVDSIRVLPSADLNNGIYALVNNSVANFRSTPSHAAQLATQALLGMPLKILEQKNNWYLVRTPDDYISWVNASNIKRINKTDYNNWKNASKIIYTDTYGFSYQKPSSAGEHVSDLVAGDILQLQGNSGNYYRVSYPDGRTAYISKSEAKPFGEWVKDLKVTKSSLVSVAKTMLGVPYLWGGTSTKGVDCSGFTKTIYYMNGRVLPRDASQQVHAGKFVDSTKDWNKLQVGDLLFFGQPATDSTKQHIVHVGMWIGNDQFIHSSGNVHISSVDSTAKNYDAYNVGRYVETRRYLNNWRGNIIKTANMYEDLEK
ncbi:MAG TPA: C40 family peptidase [Balneolaceae bacterium]|nr:C40 family peptidase [Balneolaceae bacterium]